MHKFIKIISQTEKAVLFQLTGTKQVWVPKQGLTVLPDNTMLHKFVDVPAQAFEPKDDDRIDLGDPSWVGENSLGFDIEVVLDDVEGDLGVTEVRVFVPYSVLGDEGTVPEWMVAKAVREQAAPVIEFHHTLRLKEDDSLISLTSGI